jgi:alanyl-tRNA synthetase
MLQGVDSNFHIDILLPIVETVAETCKQKYVSSDDNGRRIRRITDHVRACTFAIHENVLPGNNEEKYVIKRLLRRAVLDGWQMGMRDPFLHKLPPAVISQMTHSYPELAETVDHVTSVIKREEESFLATIDGGLTRINKLFDEIQSSGGGLVGGEDAAELYTTYGFPPELLETLAAERNCAFDWDGFRDAMEAHGKKSGAGTRGEVFASGPLDALKKAMHGSEFLGYESVKVSGKLIGIIAQNRLCESLTDSDAIPTPMEHKPDQLITLILDKTCFYGESGGQVGDTGWIEGPNGKFEVFNTQREGDFFLHCGVLREGSIDLGQEVNAHVDECRRQAIRRAHTATHLVHAALQHFLGSHAVQQGSKVDADLLRFDFSHASPVGNETLQDIEAMVNEGTSEAVAVSANLLPLEEARHAGAMMLFGEKYPDVVRMVSIDGISKELCGGTHVDNTGEIGLVKIIHEESVSAGTRRVVAITGRRALERFQQAEATLTDLANTLKVPVPDLPSRLNSLTKELKALKRQAATNKPDISIDELLNSAEEVDGVRIVIADTKGCDAAAMRQCIDQLRRKASPIAVLLGSTDNGKVTLVAGISREVESKGVSAGSWIREPASLVGGRGGGRPDLAQAGGKLSAKLPEALARAKQEIRNYLKS